MQQITPYDLPKTPLTQQYEKYTLEHQEVWSILYNQQINILKNAATEKFFQGLIDAGFSEYTIPRIDDINQHLKLATGWQIFIVPGIIANQPFFELLANKQFPATTWLRKKEQLNYLEEPDMFHDVFGHLPLIGNEPFAKFLEGMSKIALQHINNEKAIELITRLYWYTVEFGLMREDGKLKIYGAGLLSSIGESKFSLYDKKVPRHNFNLSKIVKTPFYKHDFQKEYFVIDSFEQLYKSLEELKILAEKW